MPKLQLPHPNYLLALFTLFALGLHWYSVEQHEDELRQVRAECGGHLDEIE